MHKSILIAKHELRQVYREPQFIIPYLLIPALTIGLYSLVAFNQELNSELEQAPTQFIILFVGVLITSMALVLCADSFAGEKERNSLEILLCSPVSIRGLFFGKLLGILPLPILLGWVGQGMIAMISSMQGMVFISIGNGISLFLLTPVSALFLCSLSIFISLRVQTVRSAAQISGIVIIFYLFLIQVISPWFYGSTLFAFATLGCLFLVSVGIIFRSSVRFERHLYTGK